MRVILLYETGKVVECVFAICEVNASMCTEDGMMEVVNLVKESNVSALGFPAWQEPGGRWGQG